MKAYIPLLILGAMLEICKPLSFRMHARDIVVARLNTSGFGNRMLFDHYPDTSAALRDTLVSSLLLTIAACFVLENVKRRGKYCVPPSSTP